jgi:hypothetical protein
MRLQLWNLDANPPTQRVEAVGTTAASILHGLVAHVKEVGCQAAKESFWLARSVGCDGYLAVEE